MLETLVSGQRGGLWMRWGGCLGCDVPWLSSRAVPFLTPSSHPSINHTHTLRKITPEAVANQCKEIARNTDALVRKKKQLLVVRRRLRVTQDRGVGTRVSSWLSPVMRFMGRPPPMDDSQSLALGSWEWCVCVDHPLTRRMRLCLCILQLLLLLLPGPLFAVSLQMCPGCSWRSLRWWR